VNRITELRAQRQTLAQEANTLRSRDQRTAEDDTRYDAVLEEITRVDQEIAREERYLDSERRDAEFMRQHGAGNGNNPGGSGAEPLPGGDGETRQTPQLVTVRSLAPSPAADGRRAALDLEAYVDAEARTWFGELRSANPRSGGYQYRTLQVGSDPEGGYLVRPEQFVARLIQAVDDQVHIRQVATVFQVAEASSMGVPTLDTDPDDADWTSELLTGNEDTAMRFGKRSLKPNPLAKRIKLSRTLLRLAALPSEQIVIGRLAYKFGISQEKAFLTGDGADKPLGLFTASSDGVSTGRDVSEGNTTTSIQFDGLQEAKYSLKAQYWPRARWLFHRNAVKQVSKLKDGEGRYLWEPSVRAGQPDLILGHPLLVSEYVPATFTTGLYVGMFADFAQYWIADSLAMEMQRLVELYAETNQVGFIGRMETDGMPVLEEAFVRVKLA